MENNKNKVLHLVLTLIFWACFLLLPFVFFPYNRDKPPFQSNRFIWLYISSIIYLVTYYYVNALILIPKLLARRKPVTYFFITIGSLFLYLAIFYVLWRYFPDNRIFLAKHKDWRRRSIFFNFFSLGPIVLFLLAFAVSSVSNIISRWLNAERVKEEISKQQLQTELSLLRSQVNPHFLFNTLNSIYALTLSNDVKAPDAIMKLSRIMRYTLEESQSELVPLGDELAFIKSYLELQKLRTNEKVNIDYRVEAEDYNVKIAPLLLIPFLENAFKFGVSTRQQTTIVVHIQVIQKSLYFSCENDILAGKTFPEGTGTGIVNVRRRLELLYKKNYQLTLDTSNKHYKVNLKLDVI